MKILLAAACLLTPALSPAQAEPALGQAAAHDPRADYDVQAYRIELHVDPELERIDGRVGVDALVLVDDFRMMRLDLAAALTVDSVHLVPGESGDLAVRKLDGGPALAFTRTEDFLDIVLPAPLVKGARALVAVSYGGKPKAVDEFTGFHWSKTPDGKPWIATSCQDTGSHAWWPCKDSFWHPEDKPERVIMDVRVPYGLKAVCNGCLVHANLKNHSGWNEFHWVHDYPLETYSVALNVASYVEVHQDIALDGLEDTGGKLDFAYYVIPGHEERAKLQFQDVPKMLAAYTKAFGPYPFPKSKFALVETPYWGMEHSTCVAYGSSFPAWCRANGEKDAYASRNRFYDYILVHESAHEWWGNGVSAADWGDFWIHEGFATYAEGVYLEFTESAERAQEFFATQQKQVSAKSRLYSGRGVDSGAAYNGQIYSKGAAVLHTLRQYVADDAAWWRALRGFNLAYRYKNATTDDFRAVLEHETGKEWKTFFDEWVYGPGFPRVDGKVRADGRGIAIDAHCSGSASEGFHVPLDLEWSEGGKPEAQRVWLAPGENSLRIERSAAPTDVKLVRLERLLGRFALEVSR